MLAVTLFGGKFNPRLDDVQRVAEVMRNDAGKLLKTLVLLS